MTPATGSPCITVDVEDFHDGMAELGRPLPGGRGIRLGDLLDTLAATPGPAPPALGGRSGPAPPPGERHLTLFVIGKFAPDCRTELTELARAGHEIASHGPDHGRLPEDAAQLTGWLKRGREMVEDVVQQPVEGFRTPRFDTPGSMSLNAFREVIREAGFAYVSDERAAEGPSTGVVDLPVTRAFGIRIGGGSYQRFLPRAAVPALLARCSQPAVLYYHSYDFSPDTLPSTWSARSFTEARQFALRKRIPAVFNDVFGRFGSRTCREVARGL